MIAPSRSYRVASYIQAAENLGYQLLIVSDSKHSLVAAIANGISIDFNEPEQALSTVLSSVTGKHILAVLATDDMAVTLSSRIAQALGLPHNRVQSSLLTYRKDLARRRLKQEHCNVPDFSVCHVDNAHSHSRKVAYPVVLKPLMLSGSRGVIRANNAEEFIAAVTTIKDILLQQSCSEFEQSHFLVEEFLRGDEVALDGFVQDGKFILLALFDKPEPLNGPCFEESFYITPSQHPAEIQHAIIGEIEKCCHAYGLTHGPVHAEARITEQGIVLLEMASRTIGGQCAQLIEYVPETKLEELVIRLLCFEDINFSSSPGHAGVLMIPIPQKGILKRVEGLLQAQKVKYVTDIEIHIQPGYEMVPLPEGSSYLGFIFACAPSFKDTVSALREAHQQLRFVSTPSWSLQPAVNMELR